MEAREQVEKVTIEQIRAAQILLRDPPTPRQRELERIAREHQRSLYWRLEQTTREHLGLIPRHVPTD
jgi:hypothetical protein